MVNPFKRFKEWRKYKRAMRLMRLAIDRMKEVPADEDGIIRGDNKRLFDLYGLAYTTNLMTVMNYQAKYLK